MPDPETPLSPLAPPTELPEASSAVQSAFDPVTGLHRAQWVLDPCGLTRARGGVSPTGPNNESVARRPLTPDGNCVIRHSSAERTVQTADASVDSSFSDGLTLDRLYARFDAIARGWVTGNSSAAHRSILERLAANRAHAATLGWDNFLACRRGGTGRLELHGSSTPGQQRELVPDQIPRR